MKKIFFTKMALIAGALLLAMGTSSPAQHNLLYNAIPANNGQGSYCESNGVSLADVFPKPVGATFTWGTTALIAPPGLSTNNSYFFNFYNTIPQYTGWYWVIVRNAAGTKVDSVSNFVTVYAKPGKTITPLTGTAPITVAATPGYSSYQWIKNGTSVGGATASNYLAKKAGNYKCRIATTTGCIDTTYKSVISAPPMMKELSIIATGAKYAHGTAERVLGWKVLERHYYDDFGPTNTPCVGVTVTMEIYNDSSYAGCTFDWTHNSATVKPSISTPFSPFQAVFTSNSPGNTGVYKVFVVNASGVRIDSGKVQVNIDQVPSPYIILAPMECAPYRTLVVQDNANSGAHYDWDNGVHNDTAKYYFEGGVSVTATTTHGCSATAGLSHLLLYGFGKPWLTDYNNNKLTVPIVLNCNPEVWGNDGPPSASPDYTWTSFNHADTFATTSNFVPPGVGHYWLYEHNSYCIDSMHFYVKEINTTLNVVGGTVLNGSNTITLSVLGGPYDNYKWLKNGQQMVGFTSASITVSQAGKYKCVVTYKNCVDTTNRVTITGPGPRIRFDGDDESVVEPQITIVENQVKVEDCENCKIFAMDALGRKLDPDNLTNTNTSVFVRIEKEGFVFTKQFSNVR